MKNNTENKTMEHKEKRYLEVIKEINQIIHNDRLKSGSKLPSERELSDRLQVGRSSVREALRALELLELIETRRGGGTFIKQAGGRRLVEIIASFILKDEKAREDLAETRKIVEIEAVRLACIRASDEEILNLEELLKAYQQKVDSSQLPTEEDYLFHKAILKMSHNSLLHHIWIPLVEYSKTALEESLRRRNRPVISYKEHLQIYEALKNRKEKEAAVCLQHHLENSAF
ncbi:FadR/GntR family transcriptional regulator [Alteribacillus sp. JSM 102045]|uniref:FadR/GntR family transcriptional regulator n=1 Tax=Alteribacillus sp. JSM 102045 TaxID=1562101 RepID=UPI0035C11B49